MEGTRPLDVQRVVFDVDLQAPSKCHKASRPSKALNGNVGASEQSFASRATMNGRGFSAAVDRNPRRQKISKRRAEALHGECDQQRPDRDEAGYCKCFPKASQSPGYKSHESGVSR